MGSASSSKRCDETDPHRRHLMLLPSLACQAQCLYCFGPNRGPSMSPEVFDASLAWIEATTPPGQRVDLTFHGGEPLLAGLPWYERHLPLLRQRFDGRLSLSIQSNLWLLDDAFCELFKEYRVSLGTSLDGPEHLNDSQRGEGYFARTMAGIETARRHGLGVGAICTFTRLSAAHYRQVFEFFAGEGIGFSVHAAVAALNGGNGHELALSPEEHAALFSELFDHYLDHVTHTHISTFDHMAQGVSAGKGSLCTFRDCLGGYLAIGPRGGIYSCNRFAHHAQWQLGSVQELPGLDDLAHSPAWGRLQERESTVGRDCGDCVHFAYCRGGCAYNAVTGGRDRRDPHCPAYKAVFDHITERALDQVFSEENMEALVAHGPGRHGLLRKGALLQIMRGGPHPQKVAARARELAAAVALAASDSPAEAVHKLNRAGLVSRPEVALGSLTALQRDLDTQSRQGLANAYIHVSYACNLACDHCYAASRPEQNTPSMAVDDLAHLVREAAAAGFGKAVVTGGEPLVHPQREALLDALASLRQAIKPARTVLRTNLALPLAPALLERLAHSTDQVVVSLDGDEAGHDARRGAGTYARTVANLKRLLAAKPSAEVGLTAVLAGEKMATPAGDAVRALGEELGLPVRFKPVLPLGRAATQALEPDFYSSLDDDTAEAIAYGPRPRATCGLGMNLYVAPGGACYPCYALVNEGHHLGNTLVAGLAVVLERNDVYRRVTVDSNARCRSCALRYLCGGFCRAWGSSHDPNGPPLSCAALHRRAQEQLLGALEILETSIDDWREAGLPISGSPL